MFYDLRTTKGVRYMGEATFTIRVDDDLKTAFVEAAAMHDRTGAQLIRDFMRNYVQHCRENEEYEAWFRNKVETGRLALRKSRVKPNEDIENTFAAKRAKLLLQAKFRGSSG